MTNQRYRIRASDEIGSDTHPFAFECPRYLCFWSTAHSTIEDALAAIELHDRRCPMGDNANIYVQGEVDENGQPYTQPHLGKSMAEKLWDRLDVIMNQVMTDQSPWNDPTVPKALGKQLSEILYEFCDPYYADSNAVTREAVRRWKQSRGEVEFAPTPGYKYNPMPLNKYEAVLAAQKKMKQPVNNDQLATLSDDQKIAIANGLKMNFTVDQLAKAYNVSPSVITAIGES